MRIHSQYSEYPSPPRTQRTCCSSFFSGECAICSDTFGTNTLCVGAGTVGSSSIGGGGTVGTLGGGRTTAYGSLSDCDDSLVLLA